MTAPPEESREFATVGDLIHARARAGRDAIALASIGGNDLTFDNLKAQVDQVHAQLRSWGFGRCHRIGLVLPTGSELAVALLSLAAAGVCAPLHPDLPVGELEAYISRLRLDVLIAQRGHDTAARQAAAQVGIPILSLVPSPGGGVGRFTLESGTGALPAAGGEAHPGADDVALLMTTSGTTAQPKIVPLTHRNILCSARCTSRALALGPDDRCLVAAPLFHIHGISIVLASLLAGGSVLCPSAFDVPHFFEYLDNGRPTWYVAGPAIHHEVLAAAEDPEYADIIARRPLRFIRSGSASLPPAILAGLEGVFGAPVVEAYGLSEAAPLVACNPLPPGKRKPGSVGVAAGPDIAIVDADSKPVASGEVGEIVVRGPNIMVSYEGDERANDEAYFGEWFRTGDLGYLDCDGYLFVTGRLKELINRGGQIISPHEIEAVLLRHPGVSRAVAFAMPHRTLGEDVAAAVVLQPGAETSARELIQYTARQLAGFKVPRRIVILDSLPVGPTGKVQRVGLAARLGVTSHLQRVSPRVGPRSQLEEQLVSIWQEILSEEDVGVTDDFFDLGGHSLQAVQMLDRVGRIRDEYVSLTAFFDQPEATIERLARALDQLELAARGERSKLVAVRPEGTKIPFFFLAGDRSYYRALASRLDQDRPFYVLEPHDVFDLPERLTIEGMAKDYLRSIQAVQPQGPYLLGGYSTGGLVAYEVGCRLRLQGHSVELVLLVDVAARNARFTFLRSLARWLRVVHGIRDDAFLETRAVLLTKLGSLLIHASDSRAEQRRWLRSLGRRSVARITHRRSYPASAAAGDAAPSTSPAQWFTAYKHALRAYVPGRYDGCVTLLQAEAGIVRKIDPPTARWRHVAAQVVTHTIPGSHESCIREHIDALAATIDQCLRATEQG